jgi:uncharacterized protein YbjT (DUF2867 family)
MAQENLIKASKIPYTILRSTQFFEFVSAIAQSATDRQMVRLSPALIQPASCRMTSLPHLPTSQSMNR